MKYYGIFLFVGLFLLIFLLSACTGDVALGTFNAIFQWENPPQEDTTKLGVWGRVEKDGRQVSASKLLAYTDKIELDFSDVPYGSDLVVIIEIKESLDENARTLFSGRSDTFELKAGKHVDVPVPLSIVAMPPAVETKAPVVTKALISMGDTHDKAEAPGKKPIRSGVNLWVDVELDSAVSKPPSVTLDGNKLDIVTTSDESGASFRYKYSPNGKEGDGRKWLSLTGLDNQGHSISGGERIASVYFDFTPPKAECILNNPTAKAGGNFKISVKVTEPLQGGRPSFTSPIPFSEPKPNETALSFEYNYPVPSDNSDNLEWTYKLSLIDRAGNPSDGNACSGGGLIDNQKPEILGLDTNSYTFSAQSGFNRILISFSLSSKADTLNVRVGDDELMIATDCTTGHPGDLDYRCGYNVTDPDNGSNPRMFTHAVTVATEDAAGNAYSQSLSLTFDFQPPKLVGTALAERCDDYVPARMAQDDLWVKKGDQCAGGSKELCQYKGSGCPYAYKHNSAFAPFKVSFALSEASTLGAGGIAVGASGTGGVFDLDPGSTDSYKLAYYNSFRDGPGDLSVIAHVVDDYGNENTELYIATMRFDYTQPDTPDVDTSDLISYHRIPWGSNETGGEPKMWVEGQAGAVESYAEKKDEVRGSIKVYRPDSQQLLAEGLTNKDGSFNAIDFDTDLPGVAVTYLDSAGNASKSALVRDIEWTATMNHKVPGSMVENPNVFKEAPYFLDGLFEQNEKGLSEPSHDELQKLDAIDAAATIRAAEQNWLELTNKGSKPSARMSHAMVYDSARGKVVLFGGENSTGGLHDTWEWNVDTGTWAEIKTSGPGPGARLGHAMVYDGSSGKVVLFGGYKGSKTFQDTWLWDGFTGTWTVVNPVGEKPSARSYHALVYDSSRGNVILFGGYNGSEGLQDTWKWNSASGTWTELKSKRNKPGARMMHAMAYDGTRDKIVLFGGHSGRQGTCGEREGEYCVYTWERDGASGTWTEVAPMGDKPSARYTHQMVYDLARERIVLFGGRTDVSQKNDIWEWNGQSAVWVDRTSTEYSPSARANHSMVYTTIEGRVMLFGGYDDTVRQDTWLWDGTAGTWTEVTPTGYRPGVRDNHAMVYDSSKNKVLLFGGKDSSNACRGGAIGICNDIWEWDGAYKVWKELVPIGGKPEVRSSHTMSYDAAREKLVLSAGRGFDSGYQDTWEWDRSDNAWTEVTPPGDKPKHGETVYDFARGRIVLIGDGQTWEWDGSNLSWKIVSPAGHNPSDRKLHAIAYDSTRGKIVMFGGKSGRDSYQQDTWEWDGFAGTWTEVTSAGDRPAARSSHAMAYDKARAKAVLFSGSAGAKNDCGEGKDKVCTYTWEWDGAFGIWTRRISAGVKPHARSKHAMVYDKVNHKTMLFGGSAGGDETWVWDGAADKSGAALFEAKFSKAQAGHHASLQFMYVNIHAGGSAYSKDGEDGSNLYVWDSHPGAWRQLASNTNAVGKPDLLYYETFDPNEIRRVMFGDDLAFNFAITPAYPNGTAIQLSEVAVDYVQATVRYRLPAKTEYNCTNGEDDDADDLFDCDDDECDEDPLCSR